MPDVDCGPVDSQGIVVFIDKPVDPWVVETTLIAVVTLDLVIQFEAERARDPGTIVLSR